MKKYFCHKSVKAEIAVLKPLYFLVLLKALRTAFYILHFAVLDFAVFFTY